MGQYGGIWAVVLAAGESKRMNGPKLTLPYGESTIIGTLIGHILQSEIQEVIVVLGGWRKEIREAIGKLPVNFCHNVHYREGMLSSVICGISNLPQEAEAVMILPGDHPEISCDIINSVVEASDKTEKGIIITVHQGRKGHPVVIKRRYFEEVRKLNPAIGLRDLADKFPGDVLKVECDNPAILKDIDTPEDYKNSINKIHQS